LFLTFAAFGQIYPPAARTPARPLLDASGDTMYSANIQAGEPREQPARGGLVSLQELRNPLDGKGLRMIERAQELLRKGQRDKALETLRLALREPAAYPYALSILGAEHLKMGEVTMAILELESAVALLPADPGNHANLAYALSFRGESERALALARRALQLDPGRAATRYILGHILLQMGQPEEARFHLRKAAAELPSARTLLARLPPE
jgi:tetratricopeptide (TPR) repeat protein